MRRRLERLVVEPVEGVPPRRSHPAIVRLRRPFRRVANRLARLVYGSGLDTSKRKGEIEPHHFHPERAIYQPSGWRYLRRGLRRRDITSDDVFVDFGCGKGRVLCQAARYPFARVIGVEISETLTKVARSNVERNRGRFACQRVELVTADVVDYEIPDDVTVAYLYYPFAGTTFRTVIDRLVESIDRSPRRLTIIYACPGLENYILATGRFRLARTSRGGLRDSVRTRVSVYVHEPTRL